MLSNPDLWENINDYNIDDANSKYNFSMKLADENGWSELRVKETIHEYKRFMYLCAITNGKTSPSSDVDIVWHQHLIYSRDYWGKFSKVIGTNIHHIPHNGNVDNSHKLNALYQDTIALYQLEFGTSAPNSIWPITKCKQDKKTIFDHTNIENKIVISKPIFAIGAYALIFVILVAGYQPSTEVTERVDYSQIITASIPTETPNFLELVKSYLAENIRTILILLFAVIVTLLLVFNGSGRKNGGSCGACASSCGCGGD